jgi:hypothetical protein
MSRHLNKWCIRVAADTVEAVQQIAKNEGVKASEAARTLIREACQARGFDVNNKVMKKADAT